MTEWTPSTEQVRSHYVFDQKDRWDADRGDAFDRWLAERDAEVRKQTLEEAEAEVRPTYRAMRLTGVDNGNIVAANDALHRAADRIAALAEAGDTDTHWANGQRRLLAPEAYDRMSSRRALAEGDGQ